MRHKRVAVSHYGGPEVITAIEEDIATPKADKVRVKVLAAAYTPSWDLVGTIDQAGEGVTGFEMCQTVAAMPIHGATQYECLPWRKFIPVPLGVDAAEAVAVVLRR